MAKEYTLSAHIIVHDEAELFSAAIVRAMRGRGEVRSRVQEEQMSFNEAYRTLRSDGEVDVIACLATMLDPEESMPGCEVLDFTAG